MVVQGLSGSLRQAPDTLEDLKLVLSVITRIRTMSLEAEMKYRCVHIPTQYMAELSSPTNRS